MEHRAIGVEGRRCCYAIRKGSSNHEGIFVYNHYVNVAVVREVVFLAGARFGKRGKRDDVGGCL